MLLVAVTRTPDSGIWQAYLNGVEVGPQMNIYNDKVRDWEHHLLEFWPDPGKYTLELRLEGKDQFSSGTKLGVESVRLRERRHRVTDFAFDNDHDWKTAPKLYE